MRPGVSCAALVVGALGLAASLPDSGTSEELRQALVLVDILRSGMARHRATAIPPAPVLANNAPRLDPLYDGPYYGYHAPFRRFHGARGGRRQPQYEDSFGAHPGNQQDGLGDDANEPAPIKVSHEHSTLPNGAVSGVTVAAPSAPASEARETDTATEIATTSHRIVSMSPHTTWRSPITRTRGREHFKPTRTSSASISTPKIKKLKYVKKDKFPTAVIKVEGKKTTLSGNQIEVSQAAAELQREATARYSGSGAPRPWSHRGSTRVHLARSSALPRPLPENNAFCHTSPLSALCRTFI